MNKYKLYMVVCICILVLSIGGSLAWYVWSSENTKISFNICVPEISFVGGETINGVGLKPTIDKEQGLKKQIDVELNRICREGDSAVMNLYMTLDLLPEGLKHETFIFEVVKDNTILYSGNFKDKTEGTTITLLEDQVITEDTSTYFVYVYIDGSRDNPKSMSGQSFRFSVYGEGTDAIYKENVIESYPEPTDSNSVFLTSTLKRNEIEAITIAENNIVPEELQSTAHDISSNDDGSVMLWYEDSDSNGLFEVYMGSSNGTIQANTSGKYMFAYLSNVEYIDLSNFDTVKMTNMAGMFSNCSSLTELDISNFDTSKVTNMWIMFYNCNKVKKLDLSNFDTSNVDNMRAMFSNCSSLTELNLSNFDTSNVTTMVNMFIHCSSLTELDVSSFDTSKVTDMSHMFNSCSSLIELDLSNFDTSSVTNMDGMFYNCNNLIELDVSNFDTSNVTNMWVMFYNCYKITELDVSAFVTSKVTNMRAMFSGCISLSELDLSNFDTSNVTTMVNMFNSCHKLTNLDLSSFNTSNVTDMEGMFEDAIKLTTITISNLWNTANVTNSIEMFSGCTSLVGEAGTTYDANVVDKVYARIDGGAESPGYLTSKTV